MCKITWMPKIDARYSGWIRVLGHLLVMSSSRLRSKFAGCRIKPENFGIEIKWQTDHRYVSCRGGAVGGGTPINTQGTQQNSRREQYDVTGNAHNSWEAGSLCRYGPGGRPEPWERAPGREGKKLIADRNGKTTEPMNWMISFFPCSSSWSVHVFLYTCVRDRMEYKLYISLAFWSFFSSVQSRRGSIFLCPCCVVLCTGLPVKAPISGICRSICPSLASWRRQVRTSPTVQLWSLLRWWIWWKVTWRLMKERSWRRKLDLCIRSTLLPRWVLFLFRVYFLQMSVR